MGHRNDVPLTQSHCMYVLPDKNSEATGLVATGLLVLPLGFSLVLMLLLMMMLLLVVMLL